MEHWWNATERQKTKTFGEKPVTVSLCPHVAWADVESNPILRGKRPTTNRLSHGTAFTWALKGLNTSLVKI